VSSLSIIPVILTIHGESGGTRHRPGRDQRHETARSRAGDPHEEWGKLAQLPEAPLLDKSPAIADSALQAQPVKQVGQFAQFRNLAISDTDQPLTQLSEKIGQLNPEDPRFATVNPRSTVNLRSEAIPMRERPTGLAGTTGGAATFESISRSRVKM